MRLRRICSGESIAREVLAVPYFPQLDNSVTCVPTSVKMVIEYFREYYQSGKHRSQIPDLSVEDISGIIKTKPNLGTTFKPEHGRALTTALNILQVDFVKKQYDYQKLIDCFNQQIPVIVWFDGSMAYFQNRMGESGGHAAVMVAIDGGTIILNDPQVGPVRAMSLNDFMPAWDTLDRKVISFDIKPTTQLTIEASSGQPLEKNIKGDIKDVEVEQ